MESAADEVLASQREAFRVFREAERARAATDRAAEEAYSEIVRLAEDAAAARRSEAARALQQVEAATSSAVDVASQRGDAKMAKDVRSAVQLADEARDRALPVLGRVGLGWPAEPETIELPLAHHVTAELRAAVVRTEAAVQPLIDAVDAVAYLGQTRNSLIKLAAIIAAGLLVPWLIIRISSREHDRAAVFADTTAVVTDTTAATPAPMAIATTTGDPAERMFNLPASIQDPDGFTNVRSGPTTESDVVARVYDGEVFYTFRQGSSWWKVRTKDSIVGYMHVSRIHLLSRS
jgi:hypothetical protein